MNAEIPRYEIREFAPRRTDYCFIVVVLNEGDRLRGQLRKMHSRAHLADIIMADGYSTDGSTVLEQLAAGGVRTLLRTHEYGLSTATRMALHYASEQEYRGVITVDGNGKDGVEALPHFIAELNAGFDLIQGSRFCKGGFHKNTPLLRYVGIRFILSPLLWLGSGFFYTDPTNAFRALSMRFLQDDRVAPLRHMFVRFNLQHYVNYRAAKLRFRVKEIPVSRVYPDDGTIPTKIITWRLHWLNLWEMILTVCGRYNP